MVEYFENGNVAVFNGHKFRRDNRTGYYLSGNKIDGKRKRLHVYVWETFFGDVPEGFHVHHVDEDKRNNEIWNLMALSASEHEKHHADTWDDERIKRARENVMENATPAARIWHKTEAGREWHREHAKETINKRALKRRECTYCGAVYETKDSAHKSGNHFCSGKCRAAYRRESGVDDIEKTCEVCGREFKGNKYSSAKRCELCIREKRRA